MKKMMMLLSICCICIGLSCMMAEARYVVACNEFGVDYLVDDAKVNKDEGIVPVTLYKDNEIIDKMLLHYETPYYAIKCNLVDEKGNDLGPDHLSEKVKKAILRTASDALGIYYTDEVKKIHIFPDRD